MISGADLQGGSGLDPNYITLANDEIEHHRPTTGTSLSAGSIGVGSGGIVSFGNVTVGIGGVGTLYANGGIEATTINCAGATTVDALTVTQDVTCTHVTTTNILAEQNLMLTQVGDQYGGDNLHLRNRQHEGGAVFETTGGKLIG